MTREQLEAILLKFSMAYRNHNVTDELIDIWFEFYGDVEPKIFHDALKLCIYEKSGFFPDIADVQKKINALINETRDDFDQVLKEIMAAIGKYGYYQTPKDLSYASRMVVEAIGWRTLCSTEEKDMPIVRSQIKGVLISVKERQVFKQNKADLKLISKDSPVINLVEDLSKKKSM